MMGIAEAFARLPCTRPAVFDSSESLPIEGSPTPGYFSGSQDARMNSRNEHEHDQWRNHPPRGKDVPPERFPSHSCGDQSQQQTNIPETNMNFFVTGDTRFPIFKTLPVFFDRQHSLRIHQVLRARTC